MGTFKKQNSFYESEITNERKITQLDFAVEISFDYVNEREDLNNFLLSKHYDFGKDMRVNVANDVLILNKIFDECFEKFLSVMDSVEIFDVITNFYDIDATICYSRLRRKTKSNIYTSLLFRMGEKKKHNLIDEQKSNKNDCGFGIAFNL